MTWAFAYHLGTGLHVRDGKEVQARRCRVPGRLAASRQTGEGPDGRVGDDEEIYLNDPPELTQNRANEFRAARPFRAGKAEEPDTFGHDTAAGATVDGAVNQILGSMSRQRVRQADPREPSVENLDDLEDDPIFSTVPSSFFSKRDKQFRKAWLESHANKDQMQDAIDRIDRIVEESGGLVDQEDDVTSPVRESMETLEDFPEIDCSVCRARRSVNEIEKHGGICQSCYSERRIESSTRSLRKEATVTTAGEAGTRKYRLRQEKALRLQSDEEMDETMNDLFQQRKTRKPTSIDAKKSSPVSNQTQENGSPAQPDVKACIQPDKVQETRQAHPSDSRVLEGDKWSRVQASARSLRTVNPIRDFVQNMKVPNKKRLIRLDVGDPTVRSNLIVPQTVRDRLGDIVREGCSNGYPESMGKATARASVASLLSKPNVPALTPDDVMLFAGASGALEAAIGAVADEGDNILIPSPGFPLFRTIAEGYGVECRTYNLLSEDGWKVDLNSLREACNDRTAALVVNNPSNPCGSVYSSDHLQNIATTAEVLGLPIIADEIYADMVFSGESFTPLAAVATKVPLITVGGISKKFIVPGWRLGWVCLYDSLGVFKRGRIREGLQRLSTRMLLPNSMVQELLPWLIEEYKRPNSEVEESFRRVMAELQKNSRTVVRRLSGVEGLECIPPQGAMYLMVKVDCKSLGLKDDVDFAMQLLETQSVRVLPGACFQAPNYVRIVFSGTHEELNAGCNKIKAFCIERRKLVERRH